MQINRELKENEDENIKMLYIAYAVNSDFQIKLYEKHNKVYLKIDRLQSEQEINIQINGYDIDEDVINIKVFMPKSRKYKIIPLSEAICFLEQIQVASSFHFFHNSICINKKIPTCNTCKYRHGTIDDGFVDTKYICLGCHGYNRHEQE